MSCGARFTTFERVQLRELMVVKRDGRRSAFDRNKLGRSIRIALRKRPISDEGIEQMVSGIVRRIESLSDGDIPSNEIGSLVMDALSARDPVGYVRYASVYRDFKDAGDFAAFIEAQKLDEGEGEDVDPEERGPEQSKTGDQKQ
jgi:transcriptional repressor NrdR